MNIDKIPINVLYVDDEPNNVFTFELLFKKKYNIFTASSADEGLKIIQMYPIHIVITDERMPVTSGTEFLQMVSEINPDIIRFVLTAYTDSNTILEAINTGKANAFFTKPLNAKAIDSKIGEYIELIFLRDSNDKLLSYLKKKNEIESLLSFISRSLVKTNYKNIDTELNTTLKHILEYIHADVGAIYLLDEYGYRLNLINKYNVNDKINIKDNTSLTKKQLPIWWEKSSNNEIISIDNIDNSTNINTNERDFLKQNSVQSFITVPLTNSEEFFGCIIFCSSKNQLNWILKEVIFLSLVGEIISSVIQKKKSEEAVIEYQENLRLLNKKLILAEESERRRIAVNLHDHISQSLAMSKIKLSGIIAENKTSPCSSELSEVQGFINEAISNSRKLTYDLSPPVLYELGLVAAIRWKMEQISLKHELEIELDINEIPNLAKETEIFLFRIIIELTNNSLKHAEASKLDIHLHYEDKVLNIEYRDNGKGFDTKKVADQTKDDNRFGLFSIKERLNYLQGKMQITSEIGIGTKVIVSVPL